MWQASKQALTVAALASACTLPALAAEVKPATPAASAPAAPLTIGDLIDLQRKAMEADLASKSSAGQAPGAAGVVPAPTSAAPIAVVPAVKPAISVAGANAAPARPRKPPEPELYVSGVANFGGKWFAEVQTQQGPKLMRQGERIFGTPWTVSAVLPGAATLMRPGTLEDLPPEDPDKPAAKKAAGKGKPEAAALPGPVIRRFTFDKNVL